MLKYEVCIFWSSLDNAFVAKAPELPGCVAVGASYQEAVANLETAMQEWIVATQAAGLRVPQPKLPSAAEQEMEADNTLEEIYRMRHGGRSVGEL